MSIVEAVVIIVALFVVADLIKFVVKTRSERHVSNNQYFPIGEDRAEP